MWTELFRILISATVLTLFWIMIMVVVLHVPNQEKDKLDDD